MHEYDDASKDPGTLTPSNYGEPITVSPDNVSRAAWHINGLQCSSLEAYFFLDYSAMLQFLGPDSSLDTRNLLGSGSDTLMLDLSDIQIHIWG